MMTIFCFIAFWPCCETLSWKLPKFVLYFQKIKERSKIVYFSIPYHPDESFTLNSTFQCFLVKDLEIKCVKLGLDS
jgi:hypothetical protein